MEDMDTNLLLEEETIVEPSLGAVGPELHDIEMQEAFPASGTDAGYNHALLNNRDIHDAHPITAITGLREELNTIEALKTVYSNKRGSADYYKWADGITNKSANLFVSLNDDKETISICNGENILGVVVDDAAFVGGQDNIKRGGDYGLVATSGVVLVYCESDVNVGDYITSNDLGVARKATSNCGYRVIETHSFGSASYATILLNITADKINLMGAAIQDLGVQVDINTQNIYSAINMANLAYNKASEIQVSNQEISDKVDGALGVVDGVVSDVGDMSELISQSEKISMQAKSIAESAALAAKRMHDEAVEEANKAVATTSKLREDFKSAAEEMGRDLDDAVKDLEDLKEDLKPLALWPEDSGIEDATSYAGFVSRANENGAIIGTMVGRETDYGENIAGFIQEATDMRVAVKSIVDYNGKDKNGNEVSGAAGLIAQVNDAVSEVSAVATRTFTKDGQTVTGLAGLNAQVTENESAVDVVAKRVNDTYEPVDTWNQINKDKSVVYYAKDTKSYWYCVDDDWKNTTSASEAGLSDAIAGLQIQTDDNSASINSLTSWQGNTNIAMARIEQKADANGAYIQSTVANIDKYAVGPYSQAYGFTLEQAALSFEGEVFYVPNVKTTETYKRALEAIEDVENPNDRDVASVYKISDTQYCYYGFTGGTQQYGWINEDKFEDIPSYTRTFLPGYLYKWGRIKNGIGHYGWIAVDKDYLYLEEMEEIENNTANMAVYFSNIEILLNKSDDNNNYGYWYTQVPLGNQTIYVMDEEIMVPTLKYTPYTLYKWIPNADKNEVTETPWVAVATLAGNSQSRAVSQIRQDANSIALEVTDVKGSYAGIEAKLTATESSITDLTAWQTGTGTVNEAIIRQVSDNNGASIVLSAYTRDEDGNIKDTASLVLGTTQITDDNGNKTSLLSVDADYIAFNGTTRFVSSSDLKSKTGDTVIDGSRITTGLIESDGYEAGIEDKTDLNYTPYSTKGTAIDLDSGRIRSQSFSIDEENAWFKGYIEATSAKISNWTLGNYFLQEQGCGTGLYSGTTYKKPSLVTEGESPIRFFCGNSTPTTYKNMTFYVLKDGSLYSTAAHFSSGNVKIGGDVVIGSDEETVDEVINRIPTNTSDLENDSGFKTESDVQDLINQAINNSGFITKEEAQALIDKAMNGGGDNPGGGGDNPGGGGNEPEGVFDPDNYSWGDYTNIGDGDSGTVVKIAKDEYMNRVILHIDSNNLITSIEITTNYESSHGLITYYAIDAYGYEIQDSKSSVRDETINIPHAEWWNVSEAYIVITAEGDEPRLDVISLTVETV